MWLWLSNKLQNFVTAKNWDSLQLDWSNTWLVKGWRFFLQIILSHVWEKENKCLHKYSWISVLRKFFNSISNVSCCFHRYFDAVQAKEQRRQQRLRVHTSYDVENGEFLCPLCECLSNTVIPLLPPPRVLFNRSVCLFIYTFASIKNRNKQPPKNHNPQSHLRVSTFQAILNSIQCFDFKITFKISSRLF